ncbi:MAG: peptidylprolyl isomerase [Deltaproteobacteria bacterium]|nr:peptidylprolyl isomerase [Deltaproteobacteria bacterium]
MNKTIQYGAWLAVVVTLIMSGPAFAAEPIKVADVHYQLAQRHLDAGRPFWAVHSYRRALETGAKNPNIHRQLSQVLYDLGFVDQAIIEMGKAIETAPINDFLHMELGVFCLASGRLQQAQTEFSQVLELNPGFSYGYYYLGEVFYRLGQYDDSSMALVMAQQLGLPGFDLERKLVDLGWQLPVKPWVETTTEYYLRRITLDSRSTVDEVMKRLGDGELFEELARQFSTDIESQNGGYVGAIALENMPAEFAQRLAGVDSFSTPVLLKADGVFHLVQRIAPFNAVAWQAKIASIKQQRQLRVIETTQLPVVAKPGYLLLSGVYHNRDYAEQRVERLLKLGLNSTLNQRGEGEHLRYEVIAGRYDQHQDAQQAANDLKRSGLDSYIRSEK